MITDISLLFITDADFDFVDSFFDHASQIIAVRTKSDKSLLTNKTFSLMSKKTSSTRKRCSSKAGERSSGAAPLNEKKTLRNLRKKSQTARHLRSFMKKNQPCEVYERCLYRENCEDCPMYGDLPF